MIRVLRWTFTSGHLSRHYHKQIFDLTPLSNLPCIIYIIKTYPRWESIFLFFYCPPSSYHYLLIYLTILGNLLPITCITKKNSRWQSLHTISIFFGHCLIWQILFMTFLFFGHHKSYYFYSVPYLITLSKSCNDYMMCQK